MCQSRVLASVFAERELRSEALSFTLSFTLRPADLVPEALTFAYPRPWHWPTRGPRFAYPRPEVYLPEALSFACVEVSRDTVRDPAPRPQALPTWRVYFALLPLLLVEGNNSLSRR